MSDKFTVQYGAERTVGPFSIRVAARGDVTVTVVAPNGDVKTSPLAFGETLRTAESELRLNGRSSSKGCCQFKYAQKTSVPRRKVVRRAAKKNREAR